MSGPEKSLKPHIEPKNSPLGPKKVKNSPKIKPNSNVRIKGNKENKSCYTIGKCNPSNIRVGTSRTSISSADFQIIPKSFLKICKLTAADRTECL